MLQGVEPTTLGAAMEVVQKRRQQGSGLESSLTEVIPVVADLLRSRELLANEKTGHHEDSNMRHETSI